MKFNRWRLDPLLIGIALSAAFLNIYGIWNNQTANAYYTAAVTSMLQSFYNFFFASLDPGGFVTVDKPPVAFWLQTLFASLFGVHGWSVILPQALAGVGSVILIYLLVKPSFGRTAARIAALVAACTPVAAAVSRTNNVDSLLVFTLLLAAWMLFRAVKTGKWLWFPAAFALVGVGFNIKMLQAYMVLPAFYLFSLVGYKANWRKKTGVLAVSTLVLLVVSFSWAIVVDSISPENRPYIGSSKTNSVLELAFGYNGISRLVGQGGHGGGNRGGSVNRSFQSSERGNGLISDGYRLMFPDGGAWPGSMEDSARRDGLQDGGGGGGFPGGQEDTFSGGQGDGFPSGQGNGNWGDRGDGFPGGRGADDGRQGGGGMFNTGSVGLFRLFQSQLSGQISWLLPFSLLGAIALLMGIRRKNSWTDKQKEGLFWLSWLLPMMVFFSVAEFFHQYYLVMLMPSLAALCGAGWVELYSLLRNCEGWKKWLLPAGILGTAVFQIYVLLPYREQIGIVLPLLIGIIGTGSSLVLCLPLKKEKVKQIAAISGMMVLLAAPLYWSATPILYGDNSMLPAAGPQTAGNRGAQFDGNGGTRPQDNISDQLLAYLTANNTGEKYLFATTNVGTAESYIIKTGKAVIPMGGFSGSDPILTVAKLQEMIANKEVKYFLLSSGGGGGGSSDVITWIQQNGKQIPASEWQSGSGSSSGTGPGSDNNRDGGMGMNGGGTLYEVTP